MSLNLVDLLKDQVGDAIVNQASTLLGESSANTNRAVSGIIPALFGSLIDKGNNERGAGQIFDLIKGGNFDGSLLDNMDGLFNGGPATDRLTTQGGGLLDSLLGSRTNGLMDLISNFSGIKKSSAGSLMKMIAPMIMSYIGRRVKKDNLNAGGLMRLLQGQTNHVKSVMPAGLSGKLGSLLGWTGGLSGISDRTTHEVRETTAAATNSGSNLLKWLLPLLLLLLLGFFLMRNCDRSDVDNAVDSTVETTEDVAEDIGEGVDNAVDAVRGAFVSMGDKITRFIDGTLDADDGVLNFDRPLFDTGSAELNSDAIHEIDQLATVLNNNPNIKIEVQGHTDSTGDEAVNIKLSQDRAESVKNHLVAQGVSADRITTKGYGSSVPVATNATEEGRALNRRTSVKITQEGWG